MDEIGKIDPDINKSTTIHSDFYTSKRMFDESKESIFARSWLFAGDTNQIKIPGSVHPFTLLPKVLDEPILLSRDKEDKIHCLSNVCTHRGAKVVEGDGIERVLRCRYHGRKFGLDGCFQSMPEMDRASDFPTDKDNLPRIKYENWHQFLFINLENPLFPFKELVHEMEELVGFLPIEEFKFDPSRSRDYLVHAHWALYIDNYLEGFHIPYVHPSLNEVIEYSNYTTEVYKYSNMQLGISSGEEVFDLPKDHPMYGKEVAAFYFWLFPNTMWNFYPWGLSINIVRPLGPRKTKVSFLSYVYDESKLDQGAGGALDVVEREDEEVVESVMQGVSSRFYNYGRFSHREEGVHHFHRLLTRFMKS